MFLDLRNCSRGGGPLLSAALMALFIQAEALHAQPVQSGPHVLLRETHDRWVHEGQHPAHVPFEGATTTWQLRGSKSATPSPFRSLHLVERGQPHSMMLDVRNRIRTADASTPRVLFTAGGSELRDRQTGWTRLAGEGAMLSLPVARLWEVPFPVADVPLDVGVTWADSLAFETHADGLRERLEGVWTHRVVGDTVVNNRSLPLVETTADLRYTARELTLDGATESVMEVLRDLAGRMHGRAAVDTLLGVRAAGRDSTEMTGTATLYMEGAPPATSGVTYARLRSWTLQDSTTWAVRRDSLVQARQRQSTGMLMLPTTPLEERLRAGDVAGVDSLFAAWAGTTDPDHRASIASLLQRNVRGGDVQERLQRMRLVAGDTAGYVANALSSLGRQPVWTVETIPWLRDPSRLWRLGILPRFVYQELGNALLAATPLLEPDTSRWRCEPAACDAIIALADAPAGTVEPRLRDAALAGAFARDPARWFQRVQQRAAEGSLIAQRAERMGLGVAATWAAASGAGVPAAGADWRAWLDWMGGQVRWGESHAHALRMYHARTGRDPLDELLAQWPADSDSARLVLGAVLRGAGRLGDPTPAELATSLLTGSDADRAAANRQLTGLVRRLGTAADEATASALVQQLVDALASDGASPWPALEPDARPLSRAMGGFPGVRDVPVFVLDEDVPPAVAAMLPAGLRLISRDAWQARPLREGGVLVTLNPVRSWGDFVSVGLNWTARRARAADEAPSGYAGGGELILLRTDAGWVVVHDVSWIT